MTSAYTAMLFATDDVRESTEKLLTSYNDAYKAAYESVTGQYALWEEAAEVSVTSVETINSALETQADYWESYSSNLDYLLKRSEGIEGLRDLIATFSDGSADSYNAVAGMVSASDDELKRMIENWQKVQEEEKKVSEYLADTKVDFESKLGEITEEMTDAVKNMNMEDEAAEAAKDTIQAYAEAILAGKAAAVDAAEQVSLAVSAALDKAALFDGDNLPQLAHEEVQYPDTFVGPIPYASGIELNKNEFNAYAGGTDYAERGWAMVGENGPELAYFGGGEQVFTAAETKAILGGGNSETNSVPESITIAPQFYINGSGSDLRDNMQEISDQMVELIENTLRNRGIDARRGAYV